VMGHGMSCLDCCVLGRSIQRRLFE
jgi:hypothetical protein